MRSTVYLRMRVALFNPQSEITLSRYRYFGLARRHLIAGRRVGVGAAILPHQRSQMTHLFPLRLDLRASLFELRRAFELARYNSASGPRLVAAGHGDFGPLDDGFLAQNLHLRRAGAPVALGQHGDVGVRDGHWAAG